MEALVIFLFIFIIVAALLAGGFVIYRGGLRFAKGIERGIKMVPILINLPPSSEDIEVTGRDVREVIQERISQAEVLYNLIASTATSGFKSKFFGQRHLGFELVAIDGVIRCYAAVPVALVPVIKQAILTAYPSAQLEEVEDHNIFSETGKISGTYGGEIKLKQEYSYPIATANQLKRDAMQAIIKALTSLGQGDGASLQILIRPANPRWTKNSESLVKRKRDNKDKSSGISTKSLLQAPFKVPESGEKSESSAPKPLTNLEQSVLDAIEEKTKSAGYEALIRVVASSSTATQAQATIHNMVSALSLFEAPGLNGFKFEPAKNMEKFVTDFIFRFFPPERRKTILNSVELAALFHLPEAQFTKTTQLERQFSKQVEGPTRLSKEGLVLGHNTFHEVKKEIRLSDEDRRRHVYIVGQTGTGKTTVLSNLMVQDMVAGKGFAFIDPHGDEAEKILGMVPKSRSEDIIYFDPGNMDQPLGLNIFEYHNEDQKDFLIQEAINMLYRLYDPGHTGIIGPRYEHLFRNAALTVMADPNGGTFVDIPKLFRDPQYVREKLKHVQDESVREFWQKEMPQSQRSSDFGEVVSWFVSKFGAFLSNQMMRNTIGQTKSAFSLRDVMDSNKILIANLSKGRLGELNSQLLGMIFVMKFQAAAMSRANIPEEQRRDFSLYVDEFQNFSTESFAFILSEARKYRMSLVVANQFISQLSDELRDAVFGNVGTVVSFRTGPADADFLVKQFSPVFNERDLVNLPNYNAAVRLMSGGLPTQPFNIVTLPPIANANPALAGAMKQLSAAKYGRSRVEVEKEIFDRISTKPAPNPFDSLSTSRDTGKPAPPPVGQPANRSDSGGGSSFLDEWVSKRRQTLGQPQNQPDKPAPVQPQVQQTIKPRDSAVPAPEPPTVVTGAPPSTVQPSPKAYQPTTSSQSVDAPNEAASQGAAKHDEYPEPGSSSPSDFQDPRYLSDKAHFTKTIQPPKHESSPLADLLKKNQSEVSGAGGYSGSPVTPEIKVNNAQRLPDVEDGAANFYLPDEDDKTDDSGNDVSAASTASSTLNNRNEDASSDGTSTSKPASGTIPSATLGTTGDDEGPGAENVPTVDTGASDNSLSNETADDNQATPEVQTSAVSSSDEATGASTTSSDDTDSPPADAELIMPDVKTDSEANDKDSTAKPTKEKNPQNKLGPGEIFIDEEGKIHTNDPKESGS